MQKNPQEEMEVERVVRDSEDLMMDDFEDSIEIEQELWVAGGESLSKEGALSDIGNLSEGSLNNSSVDFGEDDIFDTDDLVVVLGLAGQAGGGVAGGGRGGGKARPVPRS